MKSGQTAMYDKTGLYPQLGDARVNDVLGAAPCQKGNFLKQPAKLNCV